MKLIDGDALKAKFCNHCDERDCKPDATDTVYGCVIADTIDNMPTIEAEPVNDWINVDDRLPEKDGRYLVYTSCIANYRPLKDNVFVARLVNRNWVFEGWEFNRVTHWQPLPKPPR